MSYWRTKRNKDGSLEWERFLPYDLESEKRELKPEDRARAFAASGADVSNEQQLTPPEQEMLSGVNDHITELRGWFHRCLGDIKRQLSSSLSAPDTTSRFAEIQDKFKSNRARSYLGFREKNERDYDEHRERLIELRNFQNKHSLQQRTATYPDSHVLSFALLFAAVAVEGVMNSYFFAEASDRGLLGGFTQAFLVSVANVGVAALGGALFLRMTNHKDLLKKIAGWLGFASVLSLLACLHLATAHYREELTRNPDFGEQGMTILPVLSNAWSNPFALQDFESFLLVCIGIVITVIAIWKGYTWDDPYPGYGKVHREWKKVDDRMISLESTLKEEIARAYDQAVTEVRNIPAQIRKEEQELSELQSDIEAFMRCCDSYYANARNAALNLVSTFRSVLQEVLDDRDRFPITEELLEGEGGLEDLDPSEDQEAIEEMIVDRFDNLQQGLEQYEKQQSEFLQRLEEDLIRTTSHKAIQETLEEIADKRSRVSMQEDEGKQGQLSDSESQAPA